MKQRMITVFFGIALLLLILMFYKTVVLNAAIAIVAVIAVYEIFAATKSLKYYALFSCCFTFAAIVPFLHYLPFKRAGEVVCLLFLIATFSTMLHYHCKVRFEQAALCVLITFLASFSFSSIIFLRDKFLGDSIKDGALFYIALVFIGAWMTDGGGYIFGSLFGKHKLSPQISPKKTVEGAVGGIILTVVVFAAFTAGYVFYLKYNGQVVIANYLSIIILAVLCAVLSIVGDLSASIIKRQNGIKDYGNVFPGHGGVLDRFDSILFVAPFLLLYLQFFPIVTFH